MKTAALIDGDAFIFILGHSSRSLDPDSEEDVNVVRGQVDTMTIGILQATSSDHFAGFLSSPDGYYFRHEAYKVSPYKSKRGEIDPDIQKWKAVILDRLESEWKFISKKSLEADDLISIYHDYYGKDVNLIVCSTDKDLKQLPGKHYNYALGEFTAVDELQASYNLHKQLLMGDFTDGVLGIPGIGEKKAKEKLINLSNAVDMRIKVREEYFKHFGPYYGPIIFDETYHALKLVDTKSPFYSRFDMPLFRYSGNSYLPSTD